MEAFRKFQGHVPDRKYAEWENLLQTIEPTTYSLYKKFGNNWTIIHGAGEFLRARAGYTAPDYVEQIVDEHLKRFRTPEGLWAEPGLPFAYDGVARFHGTMIVLNGYEGARADELKQWMWEGAWTSLLMQSPFGETPTQYRSSHHIWNEATDAAIFEAYADAYARAGRMEEAGAFRRGARLALQSISDWIRPDGSGYIVKNRFPRGTRHAHHRYSAHANYNLWAMSRLCTAHDLAGTSIEQRPAPAEVGGFVLDLDSFRTVIANVQGNYVQYLRRGNMTYNPTGLLRVHLRAGHPQLGPSDGVMAEWGKSGANSAGYAVGPAWIDASGEETRLAEFPDLKEHRPRLGDDPGVLPKLIEITESPELVVFEIQTDWPVKEAQVTEVFTLTPMGLDAEVSVIAPGIQGLRLYFPALVTDGASDTTLSVEEGKLSLSLDGRGVVFSTRPPVQPQRSKKRLVHWNGLVEPIHFDFPDSSSASYSIRPFQTHE